MIEKLDIFVAHSAMHVHSTNLIRRVQVICMWCQFLVVVKDIDGGQGLRDCLRA